MGDFIAAAIVAVLFIAAFAWGVNFILNYRVYSIEDDQYWEVRWRHQRKPAVCFNCRFYNKVDRACHRMPQPVRKPADHWCGEFDRVTFIFKEEA